MDKDIIIAIKEELAEVSLDLNLIELESYKKISKHAKNTEGILYDLLEKDGYISNEKILVALENKYGITLLKEAKAIEANYKNFPYKFCEKNGLTPIGYDGTTIVVGICSPGGLNSMKNLSLLTGKKVTAKFIHLQVFIDFLMKQNNHLNLQGISLGDKPKKEIKISPLEKPIQKTKVSFISLLRLKYFKVLHGQRHHYSDQRRACRSLA